MTGTFLNGVINYPADRRIHGLRARRLANIGQGNRHAPPGSVRVRLLQSGPNRDYQKGREITLLPGVFVRALPPPSDREREAGAGGPPDLGIYTPGVDGHGGNEFIDPDAE